MSSLPDIAAVTRPRAFASIVCGIDGTPASLEAARQAAILAGPDTRLTYAVVAPARDDVHEALHRARDDARVLGAAAEIVERQGDHAAEQLIELARDYELLVVGIHGHSRGGGIVLGRTATALLHRSPIPILVARRPDGAIEFPHRILVANDGSAGAREAATVAAQLARRHGAALGLVSAYDHAGTPKSLSAVAATLRIAAGVEPLRFGEGGPAARVVSTAVRDFEATLVVTGSRGLTGVAAVSSASERIAHAAPCSALVLRHTP